MSNITFEKYFDPIAPYISGKLISGESFDKIRKTASILPSELINYTFGFECDLSSDLPEADFLVSYNTQIGNRDALSRISLPGDLSQNPVWRSILDINNKWNDKDDFIYYRLDFLWLEFDVKKGNYYVPGIFFGPMIYFDSKYSRNEQVVKICERVFGIFGLPALGKTTLRFLSGLPDEIFVFQVGILPARNVPFQRFCLKGIKSDSIINVFNTIEYKNINEIKDLFDTLCTYVDKIETDIDLGETAGEKVGFECYINNDNNTGRWKSFLEFLIKENICLPSKAEAVLDYPGTSDSDSDSAIWPENLKDAIAVMGSWKQSIFKRTIHHIKVVYEPGKSLQAKVYLAVNHYWKR